MRKKYLKKYLRKSRASNSVQIEYFLFVTVTTLIFRAPVRIFLPALAFDGWKEMPVLMKLRKYAQVCASRNMSLCFKNAA